MRDTQSKIKLVIADDHDMFRDGLKMFIDKFDDLELLAEASDGEQAVLYCQQYQPDVALIDLKMPYLNGVEVISQIKASHPEIACIVLTSFVEDTLVQEALRMGAVGYLLKNADSQTLYRAVQRAVDGDNTLAPEATQALIQATTGPPEPGHDLTEREIEILQYLVQGLSNTELGQKLFISRSTVKNHISSIFGKLGVDNRTRAAAIAVQYGIVALEEEA